ncbi:MAG: heat-inducible transcription repressor HrcA [Ignavibacteriae bacterium]|nr:heat-inducible transcription repressor HrcA [Ignavibacteriota bacterium]NOG98049.1 heat-inducible transcription repressor HrcA [Ignavibacteriota bacterium]
MIRKMNNIELTDREKSILRHVIRQFIVTANPVGSRNISKRYNIGLSPASIRNIMADLEDLGLLGHPHTSAGRVPTDRGYRFYVDSLMEPAKLNKKELDYITANLEPDTYETENLLKITSAILSTITNQLACITYPKFDNALLNKIQLVRLSSQRIMVVLTIQSGLVKTITLEINAEIEDDKLMGVEQLLNERLAGLNFQEIRKTFSERIKDGFNTEYKPVMRVFIDSMDKIFDDIKINEKTVISGAKNIIKHPEFGDHEHFQSVIELIEDKDVIVHIMEKNKDISSKDVSIIIGGESEDEKFSDYSLITKEYNIGDINGKLGVIGPKRMEYGKIIAAVVYIAELLTIELKNQKL